MQHGVCLTPGSGKDDIQLRLSLIRAADSGRLDALECPGCRNPTVSVRFTHPSEHEYRTWFVCSSCGFTMRTHDLGRPRNFSEGRVDHHLGEYDRALLDRAIFKKHSVDEAT